MESWNNIINTAMIGTDKKTIGVHELPESIREAVDKIVANERTDKEEKFLQTASLVFNYCQCGVVPLHKEHVTLPAASPEEKGYCSELSTHVLKDILSEENIPLLKLWLQHCQLAMQIAPPEMVPGLLSLGLQYKNLQTLLAACCGKRGEWLSSFNDAWNFSAEQTTEAMWQTGTAEQRKTILKEIRKTDPATARQWVMQTWLQEDATSRLSFLEIFADRISDDDIDFLESLSTDKSKKVKEQAQALLKQIPGSPIVQQYQEVLKEAVIVKKEKTLLGFSSKMVLHFQVPAVDENILKKIGIEKLSNSKEYTDDEFIIQQLMQSVPPSFWVQQWDNTPEQIIQLFQKDATGKKMMPALVVAVKKFTDVNWAIALMQYSEVFYIDIIPMLPLQQQEYYSNRFFDEYPDSIIQYAIQRDTEWGLDLAKNIFRHTAKNMYQYNRSFYNQYIHLIPGKIALELERLTPKEEYMQATWSNTSEYILKLLHLKAQITQSYK